MCDGIASIDDDLKYEIIIGKCFSCGISLTQGDMDDYGECPYCPGEEPHYMEAVTAQKPVIVNPKPPASLQQQIDDGGWDEIPF